MFPLTPVLLSLLFAAIGLAAGSLAVYVSPRLAAYRLNEPPEFEPAVVLIPLAGALLAGRRAVRVIGFELVCAVTFAGLSLHEPRGWDLALSAFYSILLLTIAYIDLDYRLVLNRLSYPGIVIALAASPFWRGLGIESALIGAVVGLLFFGVLQFLGRGALGTGDTKLAVLIGAMRGFPTTLSALLLGILLGGLAAIVFLVILRRGRKSYIAYAPYLSVGGVLSFFLLSP